MLQGPLEFLAEFVGPTWPRLQVIRHLELLHSKDILEGKEIVRPEVLLTTRRPVGLNTKESHSQPGRKALHQLRARGARITCQANNLWHEVPSAEMTHALSQTSAPGPGWKTLEFSHGQGPSATSLGVPGMSALGVKRCAPGDRQGVDGASPSR